MVSNQENQVHPTNQGNQDNPINHGSDKIMLQTWLSDILVTNEDERKVELRITNNHPASQNPAPLVLVTNEDERKFFY